MGRIAKRAAEPHRGDLEGLDGVERLEAATAILRHESGFTELQERAGGYELREYNCIYQRVADGHADVCAFHTQYVSELVGQPVELVSCMCSGADLCGFRIGL